MTCTCNIHRNARGAGVGQCGSYGLHTQLLAVCGVGFVKLAKRCKGSTKIIACVSVGVSGVGAQLHNQSPVPTTIVYGLRPESHCTIFTVL